MAFDLTQRTQLVREDYYTADDKEAAAKLFTAQCLHQLYQGAIYGSFISLVQHDEHSRWLKNMGYIKYTHTSKHTVEGGSASWRKHAKRRHRPTRFYAVTPLGIERLIRAGYKLPS